VMWLNFRCQK